MLLPVGRVDRADETVFLVVDARAEQQRARTAGRRRAEGQRPEDTHVARDVKSQIMGIDDTRSSI